MTVDNIVERPCIVAGQADCGGSVDHQTASTCSYRRGSGPIGPGRIYTCSVYPPRKDCLMELMRVGEKTD
ncbi:hypothetical protein IPM62_01435 [Candidatus Woesebacteria bacterium]|nr:MAG: hypothetical protein IPM62_01435 [Candidatus Woesebacteria bacterium]